MVRKLKTNNGRYNMALLDFMKEGFNSLQYQPQMYDPHANARRLMGGPVQEQQGGGTGFNFFGSDNYSQMHKSHYLRWMLQVQLVVQV